MTILLAICSVAISHALFWACVLLGLNKRLSNRLLSVLLIFLALRVGKSVMGMLFPGNMYFFATLGVVSMAGIGPSLYLFTRSFFESEFRFRRHDFLHYVPVIAPVALAFVPDWSSLNLTYFTFTTHMIAYVLVTLTYILRRREAYRSDDLKWKWIIFVLLGIGVIWITFVLQLTFYQPLVYEIIVITAAVVFYSLSLWAIPRSRIFLEEPRRRPQESTVYDELGNRILHLLENDEAFIDSSLTVTRLAARLKSPPYLVSRAINHCFEKSFSELVMSYRIRKSERLLSSDAARAFTIEAIAYESGFNTLSAFYSAFKKTNRMTPAQFREGRGVLPLGLGQQKTN